MKHRYPFKVLITGGREIGGVGSFAEGLRAGFTELGIPVEIISPAHIFSRRRDLRDSRILKILSTTAVFAAPFAQRAICMAHGVPRADCQGWRKLMAIIGSFKLANRCSGAQVVSVSHYTAATLQAIFNVRTDAVVHNALKPIFLEPNGGSPRQRSYITFVGRLVKAKNLHRILPAIRDVLDENSELRACIIGDGDQRAHLQAMVAGDSRFEFKETPDDRLVRDYLRRTKVFVSGNEVEGFGITFLEALSQGCVLAMPASGGGLEIAPKLIGHGIQLFSTTFAHESVAFALRRALKAAPKAESFSAYSSRTIAEAYLAVDARFTAQGIFQAGVNR